MNLALLIVAIIILCFGFVLAFGAPYVPTLKKQRIQALKLLDLSKGQVLYELGSGDGSMLIEASKQGITAIGYELNPFLYLLSKLRLVRHKNAHVKFGNYWQTNLSQADGIYVFLIDNYMKRLESKLLNESKDGLKLVSYTFELPNTKPKLSDGPMHLYIFNKTRQKQAK